MRLSKLLFTPLLLASFSACSVKRIAINKIGNALASGGSTYERDDDPDLVAEALPFSLKLVESLRIGDHKISSQTRRAQLRVHRGDPTGCVVTGPLFTVAEVVNSGVLHLIDKRVEVGQILVGRTEGPVSIDSDRVVHIEISHCLYLRG